MEKEPKTKQKVQEYFIKHPTITVSLTELAEALKLSKNTVIYPLKQLVANGILGKTAEKEYFLIVNEDIDKKILEMVSNRGFALLDDIKDTIFNGYKDESENALKRLVFGGRLILLKKKGGIGVELGNLGAKELGCCPICKLDLKGTDTRDFIALETQVSVEEKKEEMMSGSELTFGHISCIVDRTLKNMPADHDEVPPEETCAACHLPLSPIYLLNLCTPDRFTISVGDLVKNSLTRDELDSLLAESKKEFESIGDLIDAMEKYKETLPYFLNRSLKSFTLSNVERILGFLKRSNGADDLDESASESEFGNSLYGNKEAIFSRAKEIYMQLLPIQQALLKERWDHERRIIDHFYGVVGEVIHDFHIDEVYAQNYPISSTRQAFAIDQAMFPAIRLENGVLYHPSCYKDFQSIKPLRSSNEINRGEII